MNKLENNILDISYNYYNYLLSLENVNGVGLGFKHINGVETKEPCIHVLVEKKINSNYLTSNNLIPKFYKGLKTDVIEVGVMEAFSSNDLTSKIRPLEAGYSVGAKTSNGISTSGTISCIVKKKGKNGFEFFLLSNNHVIAGSNRVLIGSKIIQPSSNDGGTLKNTVGILSDFIKIKKENMFFSPTNYVDCAIAKIDSNLASNRIGITGDLKGIGSISLGLDVMKVGKMTGLTKGNIKTLGATTTIIIDGGFALFKKQIIARISTVKGDSGSPLLNKSNEILGLLMSGNTSIGTGTFNDINLVLKALKVELFL